MFDPDHWRPLPSGKGSMAILQMSGKIVFRESGRNCIYMQGSGDLLLDHKDVLFAAKQYQDWLDAGNKPPPPGTAIAL